MKRRKPSGWLAAVPLRVYRHVDDAVYQYVGTILGASGLDLCQNDQTVHVNAAGTEDDWIAGSVVTGSHPPISIGDVLQGHIDTSAKWKVIATAITPWCGPGEWNVEVHRIAPWETIVLTTSPNLTAVSR
jgi:hypothetical protein